MGDGDGAVCPLAFGAEQACLDQGIHQGNKVVREPGEERPASRGQAFRVYHQQRLKQPRQQIVKCGTDLTAGFLLHGLDVIGNRAGDAAECVINLVAQLLAIAPVEQPLHDKGEERQAARFRAGFTGNAPHQAVGDLEPGALRRLFDHVDHDVGINRTDRIMTLAAQHLQQVRVPIALLEMVASYGGDHPQGLFPNSFKEGGEKRIGILRGLAGEEFLHLVQKKHHHGSAGALCGDFHKPS